MGTGSLSRGGGVGGGVKRSGRGVNHPLPSSAEVKRRVELHLYWSLWASMFCSRVNFTFTINLSRKTYQAQRLHDLQKILDGCEKWLSVLQQWITFDPVVVSQFIMVFSQFHWLNSADCARRLMENCSVWPPLTPILLTKYFQAPSLNKMSTA